MGIGDPAPPKKGHSTPPIFSPYLLWPNVWMDEDATWYGGKPRPRRHCAKCRPSFPHRWHSSPHFLAHVDCGQTAGWIRIPLGTELGLSTGDIALDGDPAPAHRKGYSSPPPPTFWPMSIVARAAVGTRVPDRYPDTRGSPSGTRVIFCTRH